MLWTWPDRTMLLPLPGRAVPSRWTATNFGTCHAPFSIFDSTRVASRAMEGAEMRRRRTGTGVGVGAGGRGVAVGGGGDVGTPVGTRVGAGVDVSRERTT